MKLNSFLWLTTAMACACLSNGCKRSADSRTSREPVITGSPSDAPVSLVPKWQPDHRYVMRMESDQTMEMPDPGAARGGKPSDKTVAIQNTFAQEYALTVTNAPDGNQGVEMEILAIELQAGGPNQMINYDSRNTVVREGGPIAEALDRVIGARLRCLVSPENTVLKVEGLDELAARVESPGAAANGRRAPMQQAAGMMIRGIYNEGVVKQMLEFSTGIPKSLRVGESWPVNREIAQPMIGTLVLNITNTFRGWQEHDGKKCARVEFVGTIETKNAGGASPMSLRDGSIAGHYWFSPEMLVPIEASIDQNYTMSAGRGGNNPGFTSPVRQNVSMRLLEMKPVEAAAASTK